MTSETPDEILVRRCLAGDKAAFAALVTRHQPRVRRVLHALLRHRAEVEDLLQETFLQAYLNLDSLRQPERFPAWVCSIGINLARMGLRASAPVPLSWDELAGSGTAVPDSGPSPERVTERREASERLYRAIADLPPSEREALLLVYRDGYSHRETAERLGASPGAVKVRVHRGRRRLRVALQSEFGMGDERISRRPVMEVTMIKVEIHNVLAIDPQIDTRPLLEPFLALLPAEKGEIFQEEITFAPASKRGLFTMWELMHSLTEDLAEEEREAFLKEVRRIMPHRVVLLKEVAGERALPIWIGPYEADAIVIKLANTSLQRPISFDLTKTLLDLGGIQLEQAAVSRLHESIFYGTLTIRMGAEGQPVEVDCRPSDALSLAVRMDAPIFVAPDVMAEAGVVPDENGRYPFAGESYADLTWYSLLSPRV